ncbi:DNA polymerase III subunit beta [Micromonospora sediminicola]|uniref:DNA polymerase III subunit beta n=1 Tax=Micromonospora sediminicola TaxID=946078 RepID=UPI0037AD8599
MNLTIPRADLVDIVTQVARTLPNKPSVPVLAGIKLSADGTALTGEAYDYDTSTRVQATASGEPGTVLVSGRLLAEIVKALPGKPVTLTTTGAHLQLVCGAARFTLPTMPVEDYPTLPSLPQPVGDVDAAVFAQAITQAAVSAGRDDTLPMMTGVRVELRPDHIAFLSTDRYRLTERIIDWKPGRSDIDADALVPARTLADLAKTLTAGTVTVALTADRPGEGLIGFDTAGRQITSRLLDGANYPPVRSLFPKPEDVTTRVTVDRAPLIEVVKRVALVAERTTPVLLTFNEDGCVVEAGGTEEARAAETLDPAAVTCDGDPVTIGFNPAYLVDGLTAVTGARAHIAMVGAYKPAVITTADQDGNPADGHRYLLMPIRVSR